jgi:MerR family transcriptional regulator/heat shock protein HspR
MGKREGSKGPEPVPEDRAVYIISVAAELAGVHPQTLRIYERKGLLSPARTAGNTRRYSERDIARLRAIQRLTQEEGLNLAGVKMIVELENELDRMRRRQEAIERELERARARARGASR